MIEISQCLVCGAAESERLYPATFSGSWEEATGNFLTDRAHVVHGEIHRCSICGFVYTRFQFTPEDYARIYDAIPSESPVAGRGRAVARRIDKRHRIVSRARPGGRLLDLGCGSGEFHRAMSAHGYVSAGFEIRPGTGVDYDPTTAIHRGDFAEFCDRPENAASFDCVTAWDVLEHLAEPGRTLSGVARLLRPGGHFVLSVPNAASFTARLSGERWNLILLEHLWYFTPDTLSRYLATLGLSVERQGSLRYAVDFQTLALRLGQTYGGWRRPLPRWLGERVIELPIGLIYAVARKTSEVEPSPEATTTTRGGAARRPAPAGRGIESGEPRRAPSPPPVKR